MSTKMSWRLERCSMPTGAVSMPNSQIQNRSTSLWSLGITPARKHSRECEATSPTHLNKRSSRAGNDPSPPPNMMVPLLFSLRFKSRKTREGSSPRILTSSVLASDTYRCRRRSFPTEDPRESRLLAVDDSFPSKYRRRSLRLVCSPRALKKSISRGGHMTRVRRDLLLGKQLSCTPPGSLRSDRQGKLTISNGMLVITLQAISSVSKCTRSHILLGSSTLQP
ncbi:Os08g0205175 [Oryza sativa Japonica Group]|uniref:Os08g0205175 protein n=1 Tax=Oryza sativa subsp. japonica TaxID=39947 RepID=A0A0P0XD87_ORYSJ|nr:hypothetical protein EE612_042712 [Oryza sativa]BAT04293.1 Os08g0205175 [Oryza sativa Japonica Group]